MNNTFLLFEQACDDAYLFNNQYGFIPDELIHAIKETAHNIDPNDVSDSALGSFHTLFLLEAHPELITRTNPHWIVTENVLTNHKYVSDETLGLVCSTIDFMEKIPVKISTHLSFDILSALERGFMHIQKFHPFFTKTAPFFQALSLEHQVYGLAQSVMYHKNIRHIVIENPTALFNVMHTLNSQEQNSALWDSHQIYISKIYQIFSYLPGLSDSDKFFIGLLAMQKYDTTPPYVLKHQGLNSHFIALGIRSYESLFQSVFDYYTQTYEQKFMFMDPYNKEMLFHAWQELRGFKSYTLDSNQEISLMV